MNEVSVLYIEDDQKQRRALTGQLRSRGFRVTPCRSGETGLEFFKRRTFDAVLCDLHMPGLDGLEVLNRVRKVNPDVPFIIFTAHGDVSLAVKAIKKGAHHFILKPPEIDEIVVTVNQAINQAMLQKKLYESESTLRLVTENLPDIIYSLNPAAEFLSVSRAAESVLGYKPAQIIGRSVFDFIHRDDVPEVRSMLRKSVKTGKPRVKTVRFRMVSRKSEVRHFEVSRKLVFDKGNLVRIDGIARDVTERSALEKRLKEYSVDLERKVEQRTESLQFSNRQLSALNDISRRFSKISDEQKLIDKIPVLLTSKLSFDRALFFLEEDDRIILRSYSMRNDPPRLVEGFVKKLNRGDYKVPPHFIESLKKKKTVFIPDICSDPRWPADPVQLMKSCSVIISPIKVKDKAIGIIAANMEYHNRRMDEQDISRFETFANMAGMALRDIRVYRSLENKVGERTQSLKKVNSRLREKTKEINKQNRELARANVAFLAAHEKLEKKNMEMEELLLELSKNREELQAIIDTSQDAIFLVDSEGIVKAVNSNVTRYFGLSLDDVIHRSMDEFIERIKNLFEDPEKFHKQLEHLIKTPDCPGDCAGRLDLTELYNRGMKVLGPVPVILSPLSVSVFDTDGKEAGRVWVYIDITTLKHADEQIHTMVKASPIPAIISRLYDGRILYANDELARLIGYTAGELIGRNTQDFYFNPEERETVLEHLTRDGYLRNFEMRIRKVDGSVIWMLVSLITTQIDGEQVILGGLYDINERKKAEEKMKLYRELFMNANDGMIITDAEGNFLERNPAHRRNTGLSDEVIGGKNVLDILAEHSRDIVTQIQKYGSYRGEMTGKHADGTLHTIDMSVFPIRSDTGEIIRYAAVTRDISERIEFEEALRISEERFRSLVENADDVIYSLTPQGKFSYLSPKFIDSLGYEVQDYIGKPITSIMYPDDSREAIEFFENSLNDRQSPGGYEFRCIHSDGSIRWFITHSSVIRDEIGNVIEITGVAHDITEMKKILDDLEKANVHLRETQLQLAQSEKMASLGTLVAGIAHEINTPIGAVSSMQDTLFRTIERFREIVETQFPGSRKQHPELRELGELISDARKVIKPGTDRVINIVRKLRSFARLDEAELKVIDIHEGIEDTLTLIHHELKHNITVTRNYGNIPPIACFPGQLNQVFLNILINAKQAIRGKGEITITTFIKDNKVHVEFVDTGVGIARENLRRVFDPGFTTKGVGVGTGLGLSICYQIVQDHRGVITVESEVGKGTSFKIILPADLDTLLNSR